MSSGSVRGTTYITMEEKVMLVRFTTKNVDGLKTEWCFNSVEAVLKDWWANDAEKLPSGDDPVLEFILNGHRFPVSKQSIP